jgi:hypothetical protein
MPWLQSFCGAIALLTVLLPEFMPPGMIACFGFGFRAVDLRVEVDTLLRPSDMDMLRPFSCSYVTRIR